MSYMINHTILTSWAGAVVGAVEREGRYRDDFCAGANIDVPRHAMSGARLSHDIMRPLWNEACRTSGDAAFPIKAAQHLKPNSIHTLGFAMLSADSLDEACQVVRRNFHVISTAAALRIGVETNEYQIASVCEPAVNDEGFEMFMVFLVETLRLLYPSTVNPLKVTLRRGISDAAARERYKTVFQAPVEFEAQRNALYFPRSVMYEQIETANPPIQELSERLLSSYLEQFGSGEFKTLARSHILELLVEGGASEEAVAKGLNLSRSSLSRRLRREGTTYRRLFHETQCDLALQYLRDTELPIGEISWRLGFQDMGSFSRSFKRWTGMSPRDWRRKSLKASDASQSAIREDA